MPNPFKKVFNVGKKKKSKSPVSDKNKIFSNKRPTSSTPQQSTDEGYKAPIGSAYLGGVGAHQAEQEDASNYPVRNPYSTSTTSTSTTSTAASSSLPYQPSRPSKLRHSKTAQSDEEDDVESQQRHKTPTSNILRDPIPDETEDGLLKFLVRNHSLTALCFGRSVDKLDMMRRAAVLGFVFLITLVSALLVVVHESIGTLAQILLAIVILPLLTFGIKVGFALLRNPKASGVILLMAVLFIDLLLLIGVFWETWSLITDHGTELWTALIVWGESYVINQVLEIPGVLWHFFCYRMCCSCIVKHQDRELETIR